MNDKFNKTQAILYVSAWIEAARRQIAREINPSLINNDDDDIEDKYWRELINTNRFDEINKAVKKLFGLTPNAWKFLSINFYKYRNSFIHSLGTKEDALYYVNYLPPDYLKGKKIIEKIINSIHIEESMKLDEEDLEDV